MGASGPSAVEGWVDVLEQPRLKPLRKVSEVFEYTSSRFGVTVDMLLSTQHSGRSHIHVPRNVAVLVCLAMGHLPGEIARFIQRDYSVVRLIRLRTLGKTEQVKLAWTVAHELGMEWHSFCAVRNSFEPLELAANADFVLRLVSQTNKYGEVEAIPTYFNSQFELSHKVLEYLGISGDYDGEEAICAGLIRQAVQDYLIGLDAKDWIEDAREQSSEEGVTFDDACEKLQINAGWLRRKVAKFEELQKAKVKLNDARKA